MNTELHTEVYNIDGNQVEFYGRSNSTMDVKFNRVASIAKNYERTINNIKEDIDQFPICSKDFSNAVCAKIILSTGARVGNEDSAEGFYSEYKEPGKKVFAQTYGITTMKKEHVSFEKGIAHINFTGKKHVENHFTLDRELSYNVFMIYSCKHEPYFGIEESELTKYVKDLMGKHISTKDLRTFRANVLAYNYLMKIYKPVEIKKEARAQIKKVTEYVAKLLNNTPGVVKTSYIDPKLFEKFFPIILT